MVLFVELLLIFFDACSIEIALLPHCPDYKQHRHYATEEIKHRNVSPYQDNYHYFPKIVFFKTCIGKNCIKEESVSVNEPDKLKSVQDTKTEAVYSRLT